VNLLKINRFEGLDILGALNREDFTTTPKRPIPKEVIEANGHSQYGNH
jgi:hypothetical protein